MSQYPRQWRICAQNAWPSAPTEMSLTQFHALERCPRQWALQHGDYPDVWDGHGYPGRLHLPALVGSVIHAAIETIAGALARSGCMSLHDPMATQEMQALGGHTAVIQSCTDDVLRRYEGNPRAEPVLEMARATLQSHMPDIRSKVQILLGRLQTERSTTPRWGGNEAGGRIEPQSALQVGIHSEVEMSAEILAWRGKADILMLSESSCEIVDFKTGVRSERHEFQMRVYALLWLRDSTLNPTANPVDKLTLSYLDADLDVPAPTVSSLEALERELDERTKSAVAALDTSPPEAVVDVDSCPYCGVRHLCEEYWGRGVQREPFQMGVKGGRFVDAEITLGDQHGPLSWNATTELAPHVDKSTPVLLRLAPNHYLGHLARQHDRLRILDAVTVADSGEQGQPTVLTLTSTSEAYVVER